MACLNELPDEIIDNICSYLHSGRVEPHATTVGLHGVLLASKRYSRIAIPHVYHSIAPAHAASGLLALTLLRKPALAALVRSIDLEDYWPIRSHADRVARATFVAEAGDLIRVPTGPIAERDDEFPPDNDEDIEDRIFHRRFADFVLVRLPNLEGLALTLSEQVVGPATTHTLRHGLQPVLPNVKELNVRHWDTEGGFALCEIVPLLANTNIVRLTVFACAGFGVANAVCPSVKQLQMDRTALEPGEFEKLVKCFPNLEVLTLETADSCATEYMDDTPSTFQIGLELEPLKKSLRSLTIDQRERFEMDEIDDDGPYSRKPIGSLKVFEKLTELVIWQFDLTRTQGDEEGASSGGNGENGDEGEDEEALEDGFHKNDDDGSSVDEQLMPWAHKLPRSLQTLTILGADEAIELGLWRLSEIAGEEYPNLKKITTGVRVKGLKGALLVNSIEYDGNNYP